MMDRVRNLELEIEALEDDLADLEVEKDEEITRLKGRIKRIIKQRDEANMRVAELLPYEQGAER